MTPEPLPEESLPALRGRIRFPDISSRAYEHPADRGALMALRAIPGFDSVLKALSSAIGERSIRLLYLSSATRVSPRQYPQIHQMLHECAATLDVQPVPEMFIEQDPNPSAMAIGLDKPIIVISTGMLNLTDDEGIRFIIGHEVGHVLSGHAVYRTMLLSLINVAASVQWLPLGAWGIRAIILGLNEWFRKSELSCDRAGLLCSQDPSAALRVHASSRLSGSGGGIRDKGRRSRQSAEASAAERPEPSAGGTASGRAAEVGGWARLRRHPGRELSAPLR